MLAVSIVAAAFAAVAIAVAILARGDSQKAIKVAEGAVKEAKRSADAAQGMDQRDSDRRTEALAEKDRIAEETDRASKSANLRVCNERIPSTHPQIPFTYRLVVTNDGPQDADNVSVGRLACWGVEIGDMPVTPRRASDTTMQGKLLVGYSRVIELSDVSGPNQTPDIATLGLSWQDGNGSHRDVDWRVTKLNWDEAGDQKMNAIRAAFS